MDSEEPLKPWVCPICGERFAFGPPIPDAIDDDLDSHLIASYGFWSGGIWRSPDYPWKSAKFFEQPNWEEIVTQTHALNLLRG
jgi:hypothetical protein